MTKFSEPFTYEMAHLLFEYDKEEGGVRWKRRTPDIYKATYNPKRECTRFNRKYAGKQVGTAVRRQQCTSIGYKPKWKGVGFNFYDPSTGVYVVRTYVHRLVWLMEHGYWPQQPIDHINGNPLDNRVENLRMVDQKTNAQNKAMSRNNTTGYTGVYRTRHGRYCAAIRTGGKQYYLGTYSTKEAAAEARKLAEKQYGFHPDHGKRVEPDHGVKINDESSTTPSVCARDDSPPEPVQGELSFL